MIGGGRNDPTVAGTDAGTGDRARDASARGTEGRPDARSRWADHDGVAIHYLDSGDDPLVAASAAGGADPGAASPAPVVFVPGFGEEALDHVALIEVLSPRRVIVPDLRGRGPSDSPEGPYGLEAHVGDFAAVVDAAALGALHLATYSRGTAYGLKWGVDHPDRLRSLTIGDYAPAQIAPPLEAIDMVATRDRFDRPIAERVSYAVVKAIFEQAVHVDYAAALGAMTVPLLVIHGGRGSSMVTDEIVATYRRVRPDVRIERWDDTGHDLWKPDPTRFAHRLAEWCTTTET